jgi:Zn-dependent membrane protease YugP
MIFDPIYLLIIAPGFLLSLWASWKVKANFNKYSKLRSGRNITGAQAAAELLRSAGIDDVRIVVTQGMLSDHYNPVNKTLALSPSVHDSPSVAAVGIAAHEAGHAIQHAESYKPLWLRSLLVPTASIGSNLGYVMMLFGLMLSWAGLLYLGMILFSAVLLFQIVTLPVEFNASSRAKVLLVNRGIITDRERVGVDKVLNAAAMTYVAAVVSTLLTLLYFLLRAGLLGGRND